MYEDDGKTRGAMAAGEYQLLKFDASQRGKRLEIRLSSSGKGYAGAPQTRDMEMLVHNWQTPVKAVKVADGLLDAQAAENVSGAGFYYDPEQSLLRIRFAWSGEESAIGVNP
jgi:oligosaccharide 4-alpha-D-glucosyltransferase